MYVVSCPLCDATLFIDGGSWSWAYLYSMIVVHLDAAHQNVAIDQRSRVAERLADEVAAEHIRQKMERLEDL